MQPTAPHALVQGTIAQHPIEHRLEGRVAVEPHARPGLLTVLAGRTAHRVDDGRGPGRHALDHREGEGFDRRRRYQRVCSPEQAPLGPSSTIPVMTMSRPILGRVHDLPRQDKEKITGVALLVGAEVAPEEPGSLLVVDPADAQQIRHVTETKGGPGRLGGSLRLFDAEADEHLWRGGYAEPVPHQAPFAAGVEGEATALGEEGVEEGEVERRFLVDRRMQDGSLAYQREATDGREVQIRIEGDDVGIARRHRPEQGRRLGSLQVDPALRILHARVRGIGEQPTRQRVEPVAPPRLGRNPVHGDAVDRLRADGQLVSPCQGVEGGRREHLHLVASIRHQVLRQHAGPGFRTAPNVRTVAGYHVGDLHDRRPRSGLSAARITTRP